MCRLAGVLLPERGVHRAFGGDRVRRHDRHGMGVEGDPQQIQESDDIRPDREGRRRALLLQPDQGGAVRVPSVHHQRVELRGGIKTGEESDDSPPQMFSQRNNPYCDLHRIIILHRKVNQKI